MKLTIVGYNYDSYNHEKDIEVRLSSDINNGIIIDGTTYDIKEMQALLLMFQNLSS